MSSQDLTNVLDKHCRFRFRGGKEAYGVIWESNGSLVFTSKVKHSTLSDQDHHTHPLEDLLQIDSNDVMTAEVIA